MLYILDIRGLNMRTTLNLNDDLLAEAQRITGVKERTALIHEGLQALIERESARRLARLAGSEKDLEEIPRRRPKPA
jgi:Arc/MetJ family transcription regulator